MQLRTTEPSRPLPQTSRTRRSERRWALATTLAIAGILSAVQLQVKSPQPLPTRSRWRKRTWLLFTLVFFAQLILGIGVDPRFLLNGELHFPIPDLIVGGAVYRWQLGFMPLLFLVTVLISGGAWCHQLCYFGALDALAAGENPTPNQLNSSTRQRLRFGILVLFILTALGLRLAGVSSLWATLSAGAVGLLGVGIILFGSYRRKRMVHCSLYCPLGTLVSYLKSVSPWRFRITNRCTHCLMCSRHCPYGALTPSDIEQGKPGRSCTLCGDCLPHCPHQALGYSFPGLKPATAQRLWRHEQERGDIGKWCPTNNLGLRLQQSVIPLVRRFEAEHIHFLLRKNQ